jgi:signal transduction histidine kinase
MGNPPFPHAPSKSHERELLDRAAHDLKNPLAVVRASLEWLEVELKDREEALDAVRDATAASDRLMTIVEDLDVLAGLSADGLSSGDPVSIVPLLDSVIAATTTRFVRRGITVESTTDGPLEIHGDARLLGRSLAALVASTARGAPSRACVEVKVAQVATGSGGRAIEIGVALRDVVDAGASAPAIDGLASAGLGVYVALRVIEAHGGSVAVIPTTTLPRIVVQLPA